MDKRPINLIISCFIAMIALCAVVLAQPNDGQQRVRTVTIPISIFTKAELRENQAQEFVQADRLIVREEKEEQQILSIRSVAETPLSIAVVIQDDLASSFNLQLTDIKAFIRRLPAGTRVMVAYSRGGSLQVQQRFTDDLERAANSLRIVVGSSSVSPRSPYESVQEVLSRFDAVPSGRRAILLFSDGLDTAQGASLASITQSLDLEQAVRKAQRKGVAVYSFWAPTVTSQNASSTFAFAAQGALEKLSEQTGGRAFYSGTLPPVSFLPYFRDLGLALSRQFSLTYLSTHMTKGYYRIEVVSTNPEVKIQHPKGYYYR